MPSAVDLFRQRRNDVAEMLLADSALQEGLPVVDAELDRVQRQVLRQRVKPNQRHLVEAGFDIIRKALPLVETAAIVKLRVRHDSHIAGAMLLAKAGYCRLVQLALIVAILVIVLSNSSMISAFILLLLVLILAAEYQITDKGNAIATELRAAREALRCAARDALLSLLPDFLQRFRQRRLGARAGPNAALLERVEAQRYLDAAALLRGVEDMLTLIDAAVEKVTDSTVTEAGRLSDNMLDFLQGMAGLAWRGQCGRLVERTADLLPGALASHGYEFESFTEATEATRDAHFAIRPNPDRSATEDVMLRPAILHNGELFKRGEVYTLREERTAAIARRNGAV